MFRKKQRQDAVGGAPQVLRCSFCNKSQDDVRKLIAGPSVFICDECVDVCNDIIADDERFLASQPPRQLRAEVREGAMARQRPEAPVTGPAVRCALCRMPTPIEDGTLIPNRGVLCSGCIGEVEATIAETRQGDS